MKRSLIIVLVITPMLAYAQGEAVISDAWTIARVLLLFATVISALRSALLAYGRITGGSNTDDSKGAIKNWLYATLFLLIGFALVSGMRSMLSGAMSSLGGAWGWAQQLLLLAFSVTLIFAIIRVFDKQDDPAAFKSSMARFGYGIIFLMISFGAVSVFKMIFEKGAAGVKQVALLDDGSLYTWIISSLRDAVNGTGIINAFFIGTSGLAVLFMLIDIIRKFSKLTITDERVNIWEYAWPLILVFLVVLWPWIYDGMTKGFDEVYILFDSVITKSNNTTFMEKFLKDLMSSSTVSIISTPITSLFMTLFSMVMLALNWIFDCIITLYIEVNLMALSILAPIALLLGFFSLTEDSVRIWIKLYIKFKIYALVASVINYIGLAFLVKLADKMGANPETAQAVQLIGAAPIINAFAFTAFLILKILFVIITLQTLEQLIQTSGSSVGSTVGGMAKAATSLGKLATTGTP